MTHYQQRDAMDCGPTCLRMVAKAHGRLYPLPLLRDWCFIDREGVSLSGISEAAERIGLRTLAVRISFEQLVADAPMPCIVHWNQNHFVVAYRSTKKHVWVADPAAGKFKLTKEEFCVGAYPRGRPTDGNPSSGRPIINDNVAINTASTSESAGIVALLLEPTPQFYKADDEDDGLSNAHFLGSFQFLLNYLRPHKKLLLQLVLGLVAGSGLQLLFPLLTQAVIDVGIAQHDLAFIYVVLAGQLMLFVAQTSVEFIRTWILLHISSRINISLISDFLFKLLQLPIGFFESKTAGDLMQRIGDHHRIEQFLTGQSLNTLFSGFNIVVFGAMMLYYSPPIFGLVLVTNALYLLWIWFFLSQRKKLDYKRFNLQSQNNSQIMEKT